MLNKKLPLVVAVSTALAGTTVFSVAQAADAIQAPEFYGMLYVSLDHKNDDKAGSPNNWQLNSNNSRVGLKQAIPLQNGLTAIWKVEVGVKVDDGDFDKDKKEHFTQRDIYLGLQGDFGQVIAGRFNTPLRRTEGKIDPFNHLHGDIVAVLGGQARVSNIVEYSSPKIANVQLAAAFIPGEGKDLDGDGKKETDIANAYSLSAVYENNGLYAALGVDINGEAKTTADGLTRSDRVQLATKYQLGAASFGAILQHAKDSEDSKLKENAFIVNSTYKINDFLLKAQYGLNKGSDSKKELSLAAIGVDYILDKGSFVTLDYAERADDPRNALTTKEKVLTLGYSQKF